MFFVRFFVISTALVGCVNLMGCEAVQIKETVKKDKAVKLKDKGLKAKAESSRQSEYPIDPLFLKRQSKYAFKRTIAVEEMRKKLNQLFTAFIWAPSSYNNQPGRIVYALHGTKEWDKLYNLLVPFNQEWAKNGNALILVVSKRNFEYNGKHSRSHTFDAGAATENLMLQAAAIGLVGHAVEGFDKNKARTELKIPKDHEIEYMVVIGEPSIDKNTPKEIAERDSKVATRKKVADFAFEGSFKS